MFLSFGDTEGTSHMSVLSPVLREKGGVNITVTFLLLLFSQTPPASKVPYLGVPCPEPHHAFYSY